MNGNGRISILMPVFNGERYLQETLDSLYAQTFQDFEIVIVDDGSSDSTASIIHAQKDERIRYYVNEKNQGIVYTLNRGLTLCNGKYIARMDADDLAMPERFQLQWDYMESNEDVVLLGTSINKFSESYSFMDKRGGDDTQIRAKLVFDTAINHPSAIFRNDTIKNNNLKYPFEYPHAEDYAFWYALSKYGKIANLNEVLIRYRMHGDNVSMRFNHLQYDTMNKIRIRILEDFWNRHGEKGKAWMISFRNLLSLQNIGYLEMRQMDKLLMELIEINAEYPQYDSNALAKNAAWFWYVVYVHENCSRFNPAMIGQFLLKKNSIAHYLDSAYRKKLLMKSLLYWRKT